MPYEGLTYREIIAIIVAYGRDLSERPAPQPAMVAEIADKLMKLAPYFAKAEKTYVERGR